LADGSAWLYDYTEAGRLETRVWKRGVTTSYDYNEAGELETVSYSGGSVTTPGVQYTYDRVGRRKTVSRDGIAAEWAKTYYDMLGRQWKTVFADSTPDYEYDNFYSESRTPDIGVLKMSAFPL